MTGQSVIHYSLSCAGNQCRHVFDSWFNSCADYERLERAGLLACTQCGGSKVSRALMAPALARNARGLDVERHDSPDNAGSALSRTSTQTAKPGLDSVQSELANTEHVDARTVLRQLRRHVESNAINVGGDFAAQARLMHNGECPRRAIYGDATPAEKAALEDDGIEVQRLPWVALDDA